MTEYIKGARYRVTFEGEYNGTAVVGDDRTVYIYGDKGGWLSRATSVEKIADPTPEWLPGDKVLRNESVAVYKGGDTWKILYDSGCTEEFHTKTALCDVLTVLVKQGKRVVQ